VALLAVTWVTLVSLRGTHPDLVVDPLTGRDPFPAPRWMAPAVHWLLPATLAAAVLLVLLVA
jgi:hypothetical protein